MWSWSGSKLSRDFTSADPTFIPAASNRHLLSPISRTCSRCSASPLEEAQEGTVNLMVAGERKSRRGDRSGGQAATAAPVTAAQTSKALARAARYWSAVT